jgi:hypothetical protein
VSVSGKILRGTTKRIGDGVEHSVPAALDDPAILSETAGTLQRIGYRRRVRNVKIPTGRLSFRGPTAGLGCPQ